MGWRAGAGGERSPYRTSRRFSSAAADSLLYLHCTALLFSPFKAARPQRRSLFHERTPPLPHNRERVPLPVYRLVRRRESNGSQGCLRDVAGHPEGVKCGYVCGPIAAVGVRIGR
jgi:hypothetical protein